MSKKLLINLKGVYQEKADWYKKVGDKVLYEHYQKEVAEVDRLIKLI